MGALAERGGASSRGTRRPREHRPAGEPAGARPGSGLGRSMQAELEGGQGGRLADAQGLAVAAGLEAMYSDLSAARLP